MANSFNGILRLRRDNDYNYARIENTFIPANGEVCLVDTASMGLRAKVGNGIDIWKNLAYSDEYLINQINNVVIIGYYYNGNFYYDSQHENLIEKEENKVYIDSGRSLGYYYNGESFKKIGIDVPRANSQVEGIMKLYETTGQNSDGTMSQKAISDELDDKIEMIIDSSNETIIFGYDIVDN